jgi:hypothetical protein
MFDEPSANRIEFDVALAREEVSLFLGQTRAEAAFPKRTGTPISSIDLLDVALPQRFHQGANTVSRCRLCIPRNIVTQPSVSRARGNCQTCSSIYSKSMVERASRRADRLVGEHADKTPALAF